MAKTNYDFLGYEKYGLTKEQSVMMTFITVCGWCGIKFDVDMKEAVKTIETFEEFSQLFKLTDLTEQEEDDLLETFKNYDLIYQIGFPFPYENVQDVLRANVLQSLYDMTISLENAIPNTEDDTKGVMNISDRTLNFIALTTQLIYEHKLTIQGHYGESEQLSYETVEDLATNLKEVLISDGDLAEGSIITCTGDFITLLQGEYQYLTAFRLRDTSTNKWTMRVALTKEPVADYTYTLNSEFFGAFKGCTVYLFNENGEDITDYYAIADTYRASSISGYGVRLLEANFLSEQGADDRYRLTSTRHIENANGMNMSFDGRGLSIDNFVVNDIVRNTYVGMEITADLSDKAKQSLENVLNALGISLLDNDSDTDKKNKKKKKIAEGDSTFEFSQENMEDTTDPTKDPIDGAEGAKAKGYVAQDDTTVANSRTTADPTKTVAETPVPEAINGDEYDIPAGSDIVLPTGDVSGFTTLYEMTPAKIKQLAQFTYSTFLDDLTSGNIKKLFADPSEAVISISGYPTNPTSNESQEVTLRSIQTGITAPVIRNWKQSINLGYVYISKKYNNYLDYAPYTKVRIYLPCIGWQDLPAEEVMGYTITVDFYVEYYTGGCRAFIYSNKNGVRTPVGDYSGNCNFQIPLTGIDNTQITKAAIGAVAGLAAAVAAPSALAVGSAALSTGALGASALTPGVMRSGSLAGNNSILGEMECMVQIVRPRIAKPSNYEALNGLPSNYAGSINSLGLKGFVQFDSIQLGNIGCTDVEKQELLDELTSGIFI